MSADDLDLALRLCDVADAITMARFRDADLVVATKPDLTPVTDADRDAESAMRAALGVHRPEDAVMGEELGAEGTSSRLWVLDPIDGTKNFVRGVPVWATLVALVEDGRPTLSAVSAPALGRRWWASPDGGAHARDVDGSLRRLRVSAVASLADASFSYSDDRGWESAGHAGLDSRAGLHSLLRDCWRARAYGDFWSHLLVAEGAVDIAAEPELNPWDIAALVPIVEQAGGRITGLDGTPAFRAGSALTTNGLLHDECLRLAGTSPGP